VGCSAQSLQFAMYLVPIPFGRVGANNLFQGVHGFYVNPVKSIRGGLRTGLFGSQWVTPSIVTAASNTTAIAFAPLHIIAKTIVFRETPDMRPLFDCIIDATVDSGAALDEAIQGTIDVIAFIAQGSTANVRFDSSVVTQNKQENWPPIFTLLSIWSSRYLALARFGISRAFSYDTWGDMEAWNTRELFEFFLEGVRKVQIGLRTLLRESGSTFLAGESTMCSLLFQPNVPLFTVTRCKTLCDQQFVAAWHVVENVACKDNCDHLATEDLKSLSLDPPPSALDQDKQLCETVFSNLKVGGIADVFALTGLGALNLAQFAYDLLLQSIFGLTEVAEDGSESKRLYDFRRMVGEINADYYARVTIPLEALAIQLGAAFGYRSGGPSGYPLNTADNGVGCLLLETVQTLNMAANGTMTIAYTLAEINDNSDFIGVLDLVDEQLLPVYKHLYGVGNCVTLLFNDFFDSKDGNMCSLRYAGDTTPGATSNNANQQKPHVLQAYPLDRRESLCISSDSPCLKISARELVNEYELICGPVENIRFSRSLTSLDTPNGRITPPASTQWDATGRCTVLATRLQEMFALNCYDVVFAPRLFLCNIGYFIDNLVKLAVDIIYSVVHLAFATLEAFYADIDDLAGGSATPVFLHFPIREWGLIQCDVSRLMGGITAIVMSLLDDSLQNIVSIFASERQEPPANVKAEIETLTADVMYTVLSIVPTFLNVTLSTTQTAMDVFSGRNGNGPPNLEELGTDFAPGNANIIVKVIVTPFDALFNYIEGILEALMRLFQAAGNRPFTSAMCSGSSSDQINSSGNSMAPLICGLSNNIVMIRALEEILTDIVNVIVAIIELFVSFLGFVMTGSESFVQVMITTLTEMIDTLANLANAIGSMVIHFLENTNSVGLGALYRMVTGMVCPVVRTIITVINDIASGVREACHIASFGRSHCGISSPAISATIAFCKKSVAQGSIIPEIVPQPCFADSMCTANGGVATCLARDGSDIICNQCPATNPPVCDTRSFTCVCGPVPTERSECPANNVATECAGTATCAIVAQFGGQAVGTLPCSECTGLGVYKGCTTVQGDPNFEKVCVCSLSPSTFLDSDASFGTSCDTEALGAVCNPYTVTKAVALASDRNLPPIAQLGNRRLGVEDVELVLGDVGCDQTIPGLGRCANTYGLYFNRTCVCQPPANAIGPTQAPPAARRRNLLSQRDHMREVPPSIRKYINDPDAYTIADKLVGCSGNSVCEMSTAVCKTTKNQLIMCYMCPPQHKRCEPQLRQCICDLTVNQTLANERWTLEKWGEPDWNDNHIWKKLTMQKWHGTSMCSEFMRSVQIKKSYADTVSLMSPLEMTTMRGCIRSRVTAMYIQSHLGVPMPLEVTHSGSAAFQFLTDYYGTWFMTMRAGLAQNHTELQRIVESYLGAGRDPMLAVMIYKDWGRVQEVLLNSTNFEALVEDSIMEHIPQHFDLVMGGAKIIRGIMSIFIKLPDTIQQSITVADVIADLYSKLNTTNSTSEEASDSLRERATPVVLRKVKKDIEVIENRLKTKYNGRQLLSFGSWVAEEIENTAIILAAKNAIVIGLRTFKKYYEGIFPRQVNRFTVFSVTTDVLQTRVSDGKPLPSASLAAVWENAKDGVERLANGDISFVNSAKTLFTCDFEAVTLCTTDRGLGFAMVSAAFLSLVGGFIAAYFTSFSSLKLVIPLLIFFPLTLLIAYDYSPLCTPLFPGCFFDDLFTVFMNMRPSRGELETTRLTNVWVQNDLSLAKCEAAPYNFNSINNNIAFAVRSDSRNLNDNQFLAPFFGPYSIEDTKNPLFQSCNLMTTIHNSGYALLSWALGTTVFFLLIRFIIIFTYSINYLFATILALDTMRTQAATLDADFDPYLDELRHRERTQESSQS
jgi:hypothetical protein